MGSIGPDKGVIYLLQAWRKLNYKDATLVIAGRDSTSGFMRQLVETFGGGSIQLVGWVNKIEDFYNRISLFICPAASEGFNCEVLESMAHGRSSICSKNAGAVDLVAPDLRVTACDVDALADCIDKARKASHSSEQVRAIAEAYTWDKIKQRYVDVWKSLL